MFDKVSKFIFCGLFLVMIIMPMITTNLKQETVSIAENRVLAKFPDVHNEEGKWNKEFTSDFETWINDNIGFRAQMVIINARIQYYLFDRLENNSNMYLGPKGELNYATAAMLQDYQHLNLYPDQWCERIADSLQIISDYVKKEGAEFYYYQCWDKHSIYPEYFPKTVLQYGEESKTDRVIKALEQYSDINVISPKQELIDLKKVYDTYSVWGDATHWTQRGAYIGYLELMKAINKNSDKQYKVMGQEDYNITWNDQGATLFGGIHKEDLLENFEIKEPHAICTNEKLTAYADDSRHRYFTNEEADNRTRMLIIGDSYFDSFIVDDLAESFYETVIIRGDYAYDIKTILDAYKADIVVIEAAERVDRTSELINGAEEIKGCLSKYEN